MCPEGQRVNRKPYTYVPWRTKGWSWNVYICALKDKGLIINRIHMCPEGQRVNHNRYTYVPWRTKGWSWNVYICALKDKGLFVKRILMGPEGLWVNRNNIISFSLNVIKDTYLWNRWWRDASGCLHSHVVISLIYHQIIPADIAELPSERYQSVVREHYNPGAYVSDPAPARTKCLPTVLTILAHCSDDGPAINLHRVNVSCLLGCQGSPEHRWSSNTVLY